MIPWIPVDQAVQSHIHLGLFQVAPYTSPITTGFDAFHAPPYRYSVYDRRPIHSINKTVDWSVDQVMQVQVPRNADGTVRGQKHFEFSVRVDQDTLIILEALKDNMVWFVDSMHCANDVDHLPYLKIMHFDNLEYQESLTKTLGFDTYTIRLLDNRLLLTQDQINALFP